MNTPSLILSYKVFCGISSATSQQVAELIPVASRLKKGFMPAHLAQKTVSIEPKGKYEENNTDYAFLIIRESADYGFLGLYSISYKKIYAVYKRSVVENPPLLIENNLGLGFSIENTGDKELELTLRFLL